MTRTTMADVAKAAGISTALVSIVMRGVPGASEATRERVRRIADELGYVPDQRARTLRRSRSGVLGVAFELQQPFHGDLVERLYAAAAARGYDVALSAVAPTRDEPAALETLLRERCEAAILLGSRLSDPDLEALAARVPTVLLARRTGASGVGVVRGDDGRGIGLAVDHLVGLGHRDIAHVDGGDAAGSDDRRRGFRDAMSRHGGRAEVVAGGLTEDDGARAMTALLARPDPPTAVIAFNDRCAAGVVDTLVHAGHHVPADVSVVGYDDSRLAEAPHVRMTTVSQDAPALAAAAVEQAVRLAAGGDPAELVLPPRLVVRATTAPPRPDTPMEEWSN